MKLSPYGRTVEGKGPAPAWQWRLLYTWVNFTEHRDDPISQAHSRGLYAAVGEAGLEFAKIARLGNR